MICQVIGVVGFLSNPFIVATNQDTKKTEVFQMSVAPKWCQVQSIDGNYATVVLDFKKYLIRIGPSDATSLAYPAEVEVSGDNVRITNSYLVFLIENLPAVLLQMATTPYMPYGNLSGFVLSDIDQDSIFYYSGMRDGDIVTEIADMPIVDAAATVSLLKSLKEAKSTSFTLLRDGNYIRRVVNVE